MDPVTWRAGQRPRTGPAGTPSDVDRIDQPSRHGRTSTRRSSRPISTGSGSSECRSPLNRSNSSMRDSPTGPCGRSITTPWSTPAYHRPEFEAYHSVNQVFAQMVAEHAPHGGTVWVHDYQLQLVPKMLRELTTRSAGSASSCTSPSPPSSCSPSCPGDDRSSRACSGSDLVGFQTPDGAQQLPRCDASTARPSTGRRQGRRAA